MILKLSRACAVAFGAAMAIGHLTPAFAHAVAGNRIFPATLDIDDPGVNDELALPTFTYLPANTDMAREFDVSFNYAKTITDRLGVSVGDTYTNLKPGGAGFQNLGVGVKYRLYLDGPHETLVSTGVNSEIGGTGAARVGAERFSTITPNFYFGKGFGDLPTSLNALRPFAVTGQFGLSVPTQSQLTTVSFDPDTGAPSVDTELHPTVFRYGFTLQYSLPYRNANVGEVRGPDFVKRLVPLVEVAFQTPVANVPAGRRTTGTVQPGVIYEGDAYQIALEAVIPINSASGRSVGVVGELHFFLDDIFPNSIGRPLIH